MSSRGQCLHHMRGTTGVLAVICFLYQPHPNRKTFDSTYSKGTIKIKCVKYFKYSLLWELIILICYRYVNYNKTALTAFHASQSDLWVHLFWHALPDSVGLTRVYWQSWSLKGVFRKHLRKKNEDTASRNPDWRRNISAKHPRLHSLLCPWVCPWL